ncbi:YCF48-related protein [candidate division KSB1 bacterium]|nr:YCF48-related protein [candidate division KSB1 bacterium]
MKRNDLYGSSSVVAILICCLLAPFIYAQSGWIQQQSLNMSLNAIQTMRNDQGEILGYVVGNQNYVAQLTNAGYQWTRLPVPDSAFIFNNLHFVTPSLGWVVGNRGAIYQTNDGGTSWTYRNRNSANNQKYTTAELIACAFYQINASTFTGWVAGSSGQIWKSVDAGENWFKDNLNRSTTNEITETIYDLTLIGLQVGYAVASQGKIFRTNTINTGWLEEAAPTNNVLSAFSLFDRTTAWIAGENGTILYSSSLPGNWTTIAPDTLTVDINGIAHLTKSEAYVVGDGGLVLHTADAGKNWRSFHLGAKNLHEVFALDPDNIWIVGQNGANFYSEGTIAFGANPITANERLPVGTRRKISFVTTFNSRIDIDFDDGTGWSPIPDAQNLVASTGEFDWTIPNRPSLTCRLRIRSTAKSQVRPVVSETFHIPDPQKPVITIDTTGIQAQKGQNFVLPPATITDNNAVSAFLFYRSGGDSGYREKVLDKIGVSLFQDTIFAHEGNDFAIDERGLEFYIRAVDASPDANDTTFGTPGNPIYVPVRLTSFQNDVLRSDPNNGGDGEIYQMITIPYKLDDDNIKKTLEDDLGSYDPHQWRLWFWLTEEARYGEFTKTDIGAFTQGKSFWLASTKDKFFSDAGQSYKPDTVNISLRPGWNQIGHPFAFPVRVEDILAATADAAGVSDIYGYSNKWGEPVPTLERGKGYFIQNRRTADLVLTIPPVATTLSKSSKPEITFLKEGWHIQLCVQAERAIDDYNFIGAHQSSTAEWDQYDQPEPPPPPGEYVSLSFPHHDWQTFPDEYTTDFRSASVEAEVWNVNIAGNLTGAATKLEARGLESLPREFTAFLLDEKLGFAQNLREKPDYTFVLPRNHKELKVVIGKADLIQQNYLPNRQTPIAYGLSPNFPNPFNFATAIGFGLPSANVVTLQVYDMLGREIRTLVRNRDMAPGFHVEVWDGKDRNGATVASGVYFYRLRAVGFSQIRKMLLVRNTP